MHRVVCQCPTTQTPPDRVSFRLPAAPPVPSRHRPTTPRETHLEVDGRSCDLGRDVAGGMAVATRRKRRQDRPRDGDAESPFPAARPGSGCAVLAVGHGLAGGCGRPAAGVGRAGRPLLLVLLVVAVLSHGYGTQRLLACKAATVRRQRLFWRGMAAGAMNVVRASMQPGRCGWERAQRHGY